MGPCVSVQRCSCKTMWERKCEFVNMCEVTKQQQKRFLHKLVFFYMAFKPVWMELGARRTFSQWTASKFCLNLAKQTAACCSNVTLMAAQVKGRMLLHVIYPWFYYRATREQKWKHAGFEVEYRKLNKLIGLCCSAATKMNMSCCACSVDQLLPREQCLPDVLKQHTWQFEQ